MESEAELYVLEEAAKIVDAAEARIEHRERVKHNLARIGLGILSGMGEYGAMRTGMIWTRAYRTDTNDIDEA
jgi:hypothetical protein